MTRGKRACYVPTQALGYHPRMRPVITFTTDFGPAAPAVCRGVMFRICPDANVIDISHQVPRYAIREGAGTSALQCHA